VLATKWQLSVEGKDLPPQKDKPSQDIFCGQTKRGRWVEAGRLPSSGTQCAPPPGVHYWYSNEIFGKTIEISIVKLVVQQGIGRIDQ
jgi:hypothetical protein